MPLEHAADAVQDPGAHGFKRSASERRVGELREGDYEAPLGARPVSGIPLCQAREDADAEACIAEDQRHSGDRAAAIEAAEVDDMAVLGPTVGAELRLVGHDAGEIQVFISVA
jgi:hypothetical protein